MMKPNRSIFQKDAIKGGSWKTLLAGTVAAAIAVLSLCQAVADEDGLKEAKKDPSQGIAYLGVVVRRADPSLLDQLNPPRRAGLLVIEVSPDSPAAHAGIRVHDLLVRFEDQWLFTPDQLRALVRSHRPGDRVQLLLIRHARQQEVSVRLGRQPEEVIQPRAPVPFRFTPPQPPSLPWRWNQEEWERRWKEWWEDLRKEIPGMIGPPPPLPFQPEPPQGIPPGKLRLGVWIKDPSPDLLLHLGREKEEGGALIQKVLPNSPAERAGLQPGDLIIQVNDRPIHSAADLRAAIQQAEPGSKLQITLIRHGTKRHVEVILRKADFSQSHKKARGLRMRRSSPTPEEKPSPERHKEEGTKEEKKTESKMHHSQTFHRVTTAVVASPSGTVILSQEDGHRKLTVRDASGKILYEGPLKEEETLKQIPEPLRRQVEKLLKNFPAKD